MTSLDIRQQEKRAADRISTEWKKAMEEKRRRVCASAFVLGVAASSSMATLAGVTIARGEVTPAIILVGMAVLCARWAVWTVA